MLLIGCDIRLLYDTVATKKKENTLSYDMLQYDKMKMQKYNSIQFQFIH